MSEGNDSIQDPVKQAEMALNVIRQEVALMGANDFEIPAIDALIVSMKSGEISSEEAIRQAGLIRDRKQDDH